MCILVGFLSLDINKPSVVSYQARYFVLNAVQLPTYVQFNKYINKHTKKNLGARQVGIYSKVPLHQTTCENIPFYIAVRNMVSLARQHEKIRHVKHSRQ